MILLLIPLALAMLAMLRPLDHDESQYVAAAVLAQHGWPYRDFAYLQTPLQPLLFAPLIEMFGTYSWPGLRLVNALLTAVAIGFTYASARRVGTGERVALLAALSFAACDIALFSAAMARNDALPMALTAAAIWLALRARRTPWSAFAAGLCLSAAAAAKISFALPALAYGLFALTDRRHRPLWVAAGATLPALLVGFAWWQAPDDFRFGVFGFPAAAPIEYYADRPWKLSVAAKAIDTLKFLALGPALLALVMVARAGGTRRLRWLDAMIVAGLVAALLPSPTWRQYLAPLLPPLFVAFALALHRAPPTRGWRIALAVFACAGLMPSIAALTGGRPAMPQAIREGAAIARALDRAGVDGAVATLSPQFLPATGRLPDPRFAAGPFAFRLRALLSPTEQAARRVVTPATLDAQFAAAPPAAILTGGEGEWTSGEDALDRSLDDWAIRAEWRRAPVESTRFRLYLPPAG